MVLGWIFGVSGGWKRLLGWGSWAYGGGAECRVEQGVVDPLMWLLSSTPSTFLGKGLMERTVVRCAEGHVFSTSSFPMQHLTVDRIGPGRLLRCPRCARLRHAVPVGADKR
ncbi:hypothetical protein VT50_0207160 [Streptomyces antioxidans]|uniref:Uncharacterized protein n=1 Tax=Streptomyces antioxidans TaxID=1507734 RepID=A0A1V4D9Z7_9ACTN|nr:hypothetical protein VT50_0207160 [Streptomyces antioxidans]